MKSAGGFYFRLLNLKNIVANFPLKCGINEILY